MNQLTEKILEFYLENKKGIWSLIIVIGIMLSTCMILLITNEINGAKSFCESIDTIYNLNYTTLTHTCDGYPIYQFTQGGWAFEVSDDFIFNPNFKNEPAN